MFRDTHHISCKIMTINRRRTRHTFRALLEDHPVIIGLLIRLLLTYALPALLDDGLLLKGVRYTDIDYDVFTDAAYHVANSRSPYDRHTYRYTPFLASLLALPIEHDNNNYGERGGLLGMIFSVRYFGKILFCVADVICGYIIIVLRKRRRRCSTLSNNGDNNEQSTTNVETITRWKEYIVDYITPELKDALWWLYNPLPINICTRGSAESLVVLLPVLATVAVADMYNQSSDTDSTRKLRRSCLPIISRACLAGIIHGIGIHAKLYPVIYTISFMASFSRQQQQRQVLSRSINGKGFTKQKTKGDDVVGWKYLLSNHDENSMGSRCCNASKSEDGMGSTFPWKHPTQILMLGLFWIQRLLFTMSSILFLLVSMGTVGALTYFAVHYYGQAALDEGLLYHFQRVDHRHNYSMYWYWIYLARGRAAAAISQLTDNVSTTTPSTSGWGFIPLIPQVLILGFSSLGIAPYDLSFALFSQTFAFVAFNKVITAQYFTWYLCLLPLCSDRVNWNSKRMFLSLGLLLVSIITWLLSAFTLEMLGWRSHRQVWLASLFFFVANVNLLRSILNGYKRESSRASSQSGKRWGAKTKTS